MSKAADLAKMIASGGVLQVVQTVKTDSFSTNSSGAPLSTPIIVTGLSVNITPKSTSHKVLVKWNLSVGHNVDTGHTYLFLRRGTSTNRTRSRGDRE